MKAYDTAICNKYGREERVTIHHIEVPDQLYGVLYLDRPGGCYANTRHLTKIEITDEELSSLYPNEGVMFCLEGRLLEILT